MEDPQERRERLKALKAAAALADQADDNPTSTSAPAEAADKPQLRFRNYTVRDEKHIEHEKVAPAQPPKFEEPVVEKKLEQAQQEDVLVNVAPKKANWDLKRDIEKKLEKMERRTQRAILEIMQQEEAARMQDGEREEEAVQA